MKTVPPLTSLNGIGRHGGSPSEPPLDIPEASDRGLFGFYTDRRSDHGSLEETKKFLRDAQTFLGCEILTLIDFLKERGLLYAYLQYKYPEPLTEEEELPF